MLYPLLRRTFPIWLFLLSLLGCTKADPKGELADIISRNDFETSMGWGSVNTNQLTRERAHSGNYAIWADQNHEFSFTYDASLRNASVHRLKGLRVEAWVLLLSPASRAQLVVEVDEPMGKSRFHQAYLLAQQQPVFGKWAPISVDYHLPDNLNPEDRLKIYLWRSDATAPTYLDDITIRAIE